MIVIPQPTLVPYDVYGAKRPREDDSSHVQAFDRGPYKRLCQPATLVYTAASAVRAGLPQQTPAHSFRVLDRPSPPLRDDDQDGHYVFSLGESLSSRYKILSKMGEGTFGRVLECWDRKKREYVAIKIVRNVPKYRHAALIELEVLNTLEHNDPTGSKHCIALREWFDYRGHVCMVFERLGLSLFDFMRKNNYRPFSVGLVQAFTRQLLEAVAYMHRLNLIHTDLKPENILLCCHEPATSGTENFRVATTPVCSQIKVIDFGSATFESDYHSLVVSTRHYRAPEVILGLGWSTPCDVWSIGCILVELLTGEALFQTHENMEHLAMMEAILGPIPLSLARQCQSNGGVASKFFRSTGALAWPEAAVTRKSIKAVKRLGTLREIMLQQGDPSARPYLLELVELISWMLQYDPLARISAADALRHSFLLRRFGAADTVSLSPPPMGLPVSLHLQPTLPGSALVSNTLVLTSGLPTAYYVLSETPC